MSESKAPYSTLGRHLKYVREQSQQSLAEVSGAVEIDEASLARIEEGTERPAEEILLLLISHFDVHEREAIQLWELAEYDNPVPDQLKPEADIQIGKSTVMLLALDMRTMYSDGISVDASNAGLTLTFTQLSGKAQSMPVARIGMSQEQTQVVINALQAALLKVKYESGIKLLPPRIDE